MSRVPGKVESQYELRGAHPPLPLPSAREFKPGPSGPLRSAPCPASGPQGYLEHHGPRGHAVDADQVVRPNAHPPLAWEGEEGTGSWETQQLRAGPLGTWGTKVTPQLPHAPGENTTEWLLLMKGDGGVGKGGTGPYGSLGATGDSPTPSWPLTEWGELETQDGAILTAHHMLLAASGGLQPLLATGGAHQHPILLGTGAQAHYLGGRQQGRGRSGPGRAWEGVRGTGTHPGADLLRASWLPGPDKQAHTSGPQSFHL